MSNDDDDDKHFELLRAATAAIEAMDKRIRALDEEVAKLRIWQMTAKDILGRLMSYVAILDGDEEKTLKDFSLGGDYISDKLNAADFDDVSERMRGEKDKLVAYARSLLRGER